MNKKTKRLLLGIYVVALFSIVSSATLAYFTYVEVSNVSPEIKSTTATIMDWLVFNTGEPLYIYASDDNFSEGMGDLSDSSVASATLQIENSDGAPKTYYYNIKLNIDSNGFSYSTNDKKAELLFKVIGPDGKEITEIPGLNYVTSNGYSGFDITTSVGEYYIARNFEITTNSYIRQEWKLALIFVNLDTSQDINAGTGVNATLEMESVYNNV